MSNCLTADEVYEVTHRTRPSAQLRSLRAMGIEARLRADNTVLVLRSAVEAKLGPAPAKRRATEPNWSALDAPQKTA